MAVATPVSVVVPAYQEAASIAPALGRLVRVLEGTLRPFEVLVVSDGSTDGTADIARALQLPGVRVIEYSPNRGKGHALRTGFRETTNPIVGFIDGDLDLDPVVLPGFFDRIDRGAADVVVGSKVHPESQVEYPFTRRVASKAFKLASRAALGLDLGDTQTGIKAMRRAVASDAIEESTTTGFAFDLEMLCRMVDDGARIVEAPVIINYDFTTTVDRASVVEALRELRNVSRRRRRRLARRAAGAVAP